MVVESYLVIVESFTGWRAAPPYALALAASGPPLPKSQEGGASGTQKAVTAMLLLVDNSERVFFFMVALRQK